MKKLLVQIFVFVGMVIGVCLGACAESADDNWPAWRGPRATGVAPKGNPPLTWSEKENIKWKVKIPAHGDSSPIVWGGKVFLQTAIETDKKGESATQEPAKPSFHGGKTPANLFKFDLVCLDRETGKILWRQTVREALPHEGHHPNHGYASFSPVTDGRHVWANFGSRGLYCYDLNGVRVWNKELGKMKMRAGFGEAGSLALAGNAVIVVADQEGDSYIMAVDKKTGETLWKTDRDEGSNWSTPLVVDVGGKEQIIVNATGRVRSYNALDGTVIWECGGQTSNAIPTPVSGFGMVYCTSGFRGSALQAIELGRKGNLTDSDAVAWKVNEATPYVPSPLLAGGKLYVCSENKGIISCYNAKTGEAYYVKQKLEGIKSIYASPVAADGRVYFTGRKGSVQVIKLADEYEVLATNKLDDEFDATPAIVGGEIFLKGNTYLYCIANGK